ncbi:DUF3899 domain-containing protein [Oceanobacillus piezotolerans]|nr:DUF3899 domain-containing protein [Oceanobacillus piezotolerans]
MTKNKGVFLIFNLILTILLTWIFFDSFSLVNLINALFFISFAYLMITLFLYTVKGGFYDGVTFGFRRFIHVMSRNKDYLDEWKDKPMPSETTNEKFYQLIKYQAIALLSLFVILLVAYYLV